MSAAKFTADLNRWMDRLHGKLDRAVQNIGFSLAEEVIVGGAYSPGSPVDTGFFRANWITSIGSVPAVQALDRPTGAKAGQFFADLNAITLILIKARAGARIFIVNPTVYGPALEKGHSGQAPRGMVRITVAAGQHIVDDVVREMTRAA